MINKANVNKDSRIFLVDDDPFWTAMLYKMLVDLGYQNICSFSCGTDFLQSLHLNPDIIFLDYQMEDMDGIEVLVRTKQENPEINIIFCTGYEDLNIAVHAIEFGSSEYLLKNNVDLQSLHATLNGISTGFHKTEVQ
ncbi:MAG: response regulator [Bacteroidia bacterium]|nr:response regulator [Bacteroidia bacterium]